MQQLIYHGASHRPCKTSYPIPHTPNRYMVGMSGTRLLIPLYALACPNNFLHSEPNYTLAVTLVGWVGLQLLVLILQVSHPASHVSSFVSRHMSAPPHQRQCLGRAASGGALAPEPPRATRSQQESRSARRRRVLARRRRAPTGSDQSHEDGANRGVSWNHGLFRNLNYFFWVEPESHLRGG